ncbi:TPA: hypothetical protein HA235_04585 [Candidatus Woesearchaeota archaeon]|nr:UPF0147 family protein [Candidatus Woesearchaeota archaeon]HIH31958.1 hypothetical protein [Candidatus Woesearchaeota archaeon]HIH54475.1 hypothetical protein [Candidatus Woesearchaeota archaeon]HIJ02124.1 hypothetical protein [Candidatus Woesearchaeota archaeon]HIJ13172.1 hypothetical protein [Candidatus Woesearchaeota archaeon]
MIAKLQENINEILKALASLKEDESVPKNIRAKIEEIIVILNEDSDISGKVGKSLHTLDEVSEDLNIQPFIRTQIWNITSMLEKLNH